MKKFLKNINKALLFGLGVALFFSARLLLVDFNILGTEISNDFTRVFLFGVDVLVLIFLAVLFFLKKKEIKLKLHLQNPLTWLFVFIFWAGLSLFANGHPLATEQIFRLILGAGLFFIFWHLSHTEKRLFGYGLILGATLQSFLALGQVIKGGSLGLMKLGESPLIIGEPGVATITFLGEKVLRGYGTLPHANILAFFLCLSLLMAIYIYQKETSLRLKRLLLASIILIALGLTLTFSRAFLTLGLLGSGLLLFYRQPLNLGLFKGVFQTRQPVGAFNRKAWLVLGLAVLVVGAVFWQRAGLPDRSLELRGLYNQVAVEQIKPNPLTGVGLGQQVLYSNAPLQNALDSHEMSYEIWMHESAHNTFLIIGVELGFVGLILFLMFLFSIIKVSEFKRLSSHAFALTILGIFLIALLWEHLIWTNPNSLYLFFALLGFLQINAASQV